MLRNKSTTGICGLALVALTACSTARPPVTTAPEKPVEPIAFPTEEHDAYLGAGNNIVSGQAFLRQQGGGTVTCAGSEVLLVPATRYFKASLLLSRLRVIPASDLYTHIAAGYDSVVHRSQCDGQGNFSFAAIPAGAWLISTHVEWVVAYERQGGQLQKTVDIVDGAAAAPVFLTNTDLQ